MIRTLERESSPGSGLYTGITSGTFDELADTLTLQHEEVLTSQTMRFKYSIMTAAFPETTKKEKIFTIQGVYCPMIAPEFKTEYTYDLASEDPLIIMPVGADNGFCQFTCSYSHLPGEPFSVSPDLQSEEPGPGSSCDGLLVSPSSDDSLVGSVHTIEFSFSSQLFQDYFPPKSATFKVMLTSTAQHCEPNLLLEHLDGIVIVDGEQEKVALEKSSNGNCMYRFEFVDAVTRQDVDTSLFQIEQATFLQVYPHNKLMVHEMSHASLLITPSKPEHVGMYFLELTIVDDINQLVKSVRFKVTVLDF